MSRMDRYKDIHKKAKPLKRDTGVFLLKRTKRTRMENEEDATRIYERAAFI